MMTRESKHRERGFLLALADFMDNQGVSLFSVDRDSDMEAWLPATYDKNLEEVVDAECHTYLGGHITADSLREYVQKKDR